MKVQNCQKIALKLFSLNLKRLLTDRASEALQNNSEIELSSIDEIQTESLHIYSLTIFGFFEYFGVFPIAGPNHYIAITSQFSFSQFSVNSRGPISENCGVTQYVYVSIPEKLNRNRYFLSQIMGLEKSLIKQVCSFQFWYSVIGVTECVYHVS